MNLFDKFVVRIIGKPVFTGKYDRVCYNLFKEIPPRATFYAYCKEHKYYSAVPTLEKGIFVIKCPKCENSMGIKIEGRKWLYEKETT